MLQPMTDWYWFTEQGQLMLSLGSQWQCTTAYGHKHIVDLPQNKQLFSLSDTECYLTFGESLLASSGQFSEAQLTHILINATAAFMFHKPIAPKSWLFKPVSDYGSHHKLAKLNSQFGSAVVLVLTDEQNLTTCMLISPQLQISPSKQLKQFELIKVAKDRLEPLVSQVNALLTA
ncbi:cell division protein ZapC domain-containing protein [Paraglaciecola aestuariivivens]